MTRNPYQHENEFEYNRKHSLKRANVDERLEKIKRCWILEHEYVSETVQDACTSPFSSYTLEVEEGKISCPNHEDKKNCKGIELPEIEEIHFFLRYFY